MFFQKNLLWKLVIYDDSGRETSFIFKISGSSIQRVEDIPDVQPGWLTEIPMTKLFNALFEGESLTSLYVRINDCVFADMIESEIQDVDIMSDPLLRILFDGALASYQKAQLSRIQK